jgi:hypothetical protein
VTVGVTLGRYAELRMNGGRAAASRGGGCKRWLQEAKRNATRATAR